MELAGRVAIVTGGGNGIGRGIALELGARGAAIVLADLAIDAARGVAEELEKSGARALAVEADVTSRSSTGHMMQEALSGFGRVDILVNNAGVGGAPGWWERAASSTEDWDAAFAVNVRGIVYATESVQEHMKDRRTGKIVNIASVAGRKGAGGFAHYSASKASAINVSQAFALQLAPFNINVNAIAPGLLWTGLWHRIAERRQQQRPEERSLNGRDIFLARVRETTPLNREQTPEDVGKVAAFLCSERSRNITGQTINVNGGWLMD